MAHKKRWAIWKCKTKGCKPIPTRYEVEEKRFFIRNWHGRNNAVLLVLNECACIVYLVRKASTNFEFNSNKCIAQFHSHYYQSNNYLHINGFAFTHIYLFVLPCAGLERMRTQSRSASRIGFRLYMLFALHLCWPFSTCKLLANTHFQIIRVSTPLLVLL